jgi:transcriptional regulator with XRE-family HTH domain
MPLGKAPHYQIARWLNELSGSLSVSELVVRSGISRYAIARWLQGKTRPRLHDFLRLVEVRRRTSPVGSASRSPRRSACSRGSRQQASCGASTGASSSESR